MKAISHPAERVIVAPCTAKHSQAPALPLFLFFFTLALRRPRPIPSLPYVRVCLSPVFAVVLRVTQIRAIITLRVGLTYVNRT